MSAETMPLLHNQAVQAIQDSKTNDVVPEPLDAAVDINSFMNSYKSQYNALFFVSAVLLLPVWIMVKTPQISSSLSLRLIGMFAGQFVNLAFFMSFALRVRAWAVKREGNTEQFVKDITSLRNGSPRAQGAIILSAPFYFLTAAMFFFSLELIGYIMPGSLSAIEIPALEIVEMLLYQITIVAGGVFVGRGIVIAGKFGMPPAPAAESSELEQIITVQEKV